MRKKQTLRAETQKTIRSLIATLTIMIGVLAVVYLVTTNEKSQRGYTLQQLKIESEDLKSTNEKTNHPNHQSHGLQRDAGERKGRRNGRSGRKALCDRGG